MPPNAQPLGSRCHSLAHKLLKPVTQTIEVAAAHRHFILFPLRLVCLLIGNILFFILFFGAAAIMKDGPAKRDWMLKCVQVRPVCCGVLDHLNLCCVLCTRSAEYYQALAPLLLQCHPCANTVVHAHSSTVLQLLTAPADYQVLANYSYAAVPVWLLHDVMERCGALPRAQAHPRAWQGVRMFP